jgi:hypothetical protein
MTRWSRGLGSLPRPGLAGKALGDFLWMQIMDERVWALTLLTVSHSPPRFKKKKKRSRREIFDSALVWPGWDGGLHWLEP